MGTCEYGDSNTCAGGKVWHSNSKAAPSRPRPHNACQRTHHLLCTHSQRRQELRASRGRPRGVARKPMGPNERVRRSQARAPPTGSHKRPCTRTRITQAPCSPCWPRASCTATCLVIVHAPLALGLCCGEEHVHVLGRQLRLQRGGQCSEHACAQVRGAAPQQACGCSGNNRSAAIAAPHAATRPPTAPPPPAHLLPQQPALLDELHEHEAVHLVELVVAVAKAGKALEHGAQLACAVGGRAQAGRRAGMCACTHTLLAACAHARTAKLVRPRPRPRAHSYTPPRPHAPSASMPRCARSCCRTRVARPSATTCA